MTLSWGSAISRGHIHAQVKKALRNTGVRKFVFHNLRNTALTEWARRQGIPVDAAMKASGHSSVQIHKRYVDSGRPILQTPSGLRKLVDKLVNKLINQRD
jgi:integrase